MTRDVLITSPCEFGNTFIKEVALVTGFKATTISMMEMMLHLENSNVDLKLHIEM